MNSPYKFSDPLGLLPASTSPSPGSYGCSAEFDSCNDGDFWGTWDTGPTPDSNTAQAQTPATQETEHAADDSHQQAEEPPPPPPPTAEQNPDPSSAILNGPVKVTGGILTYGAHTFRGDVSPFGDIQFTIDLNTMEQAEADQLLSNKGTTFAVALDLDLGSSKNTPIETVFVETKGKIPARTKQDGTVVPEREALLSHQVVSGTSRVMTPTSSNSNVAATSDGKLTFSGSGSRSTAFFGGYFNSNPDSKRTSSFRLTVFTERPDYREHESTSFTVRLTLIPRR